MKNSTRLIIGFVVVFVTSFGIAAFGSNAYDSSFNLRVWNNSGQFYYNNFGRRDVGCIDINGEVGHSLWVKGPTAVCEPDNNWGGQFSIVSGTLPPGVEMDNAGNISGIPTERGHWIVVVTVSNIQCNGIPNNMDFTAQLCFHITGTGKVIE